MSGPAGEEREIKLAVAEGFVVPSLELLGGRVTDRGEEVLDATYMDTPDMRLARSVAGLRHRNGVWTFKGPSRRDGDAVVREEIEVAGSSSTLPAEIRDRIGSAIDIRLLQAIARLHTIRHAWDIAHGDEAVELVHDRVSVRDGATEVLRFEEVEVEHSPTSRALAERVARVIVESGGHVETMSKYARALAALGHSVPEAAL